MRRHLLLMLILMLLMPVRAQQADDEDHPLLQMLSLIGPSDRDFISYVDIRAVEQSRRTPVSPASFAAFNALPEENQDLWLEAVRRIQAGPTEIFQYFVMTENMPQIVGFDFFDIDRALSYGQPPSHGTIFQGDFDMQAVASALKARGYTDEMASGLPVWCGENGCDSGMMVNIQSREPANIFDPALGRIPPVLPVGEQFLVSSPDFAIIQAAASATSGSGRSVMQDFRYAVVAHALSSAEGDLLQVNFFNRAEVDADFDLSLFETREDYEAAAESQANIPPILEEWFGYEALPSMYNIVAFADRQIEDMQVVTLAVAFATEEEAQQGAAELAKRLQTFSGVLLTDDPTPFITRVEGTMLDEATITAYPEDDPRAYAVLVSIAYPLPEVEGEDTPPGRLYRIFIQAVYNRSFYPLWDVQLPEWAFEGQ